MTAPQYRMVPVEPTEPQWSGLARDIVMWHRMGDRPTGHRLFEHLRMRGAAIPDWLRKEIPDTDHVPPKGTIAAIIYRAMIDDAPQPPAMTREDAEKARMWDWCAKHSCFPYRDYEAWCGDDWAVDAPSGTVYGPNPEAAAAMAIDAAMKATEVTK